MKFLVMYAYPPELDGQCLQGHNLMRGLNEVGAQAMPCDPEDSLQKKWLYETFKPDYTIGIGYWGDVPRMVEDPMKHGLNAIPWFNADGWVANYHDVFNKLPLMFVTSNWTKSTYMRDGMHGKNIEVMPIGYDHHVFKPMAKFDPKVQKVREMLGVEPDEKMILTVGGDVTSKGAQEMFKALKIVDQKFHKWKYVMKTWESFSARNHGREEIVLLKELGLDKHKMVTLGGKFTPEFMTVLLNACDIYAAPSRLEGFGMIQLEAEASGVPVISIDAGGPKDTIIHGKTGFLAKVSEEIKLDREWVYPHMGFESKHQIEFDKPKTFAYRADHHELADYTLKLLTDDKLREQMGKAAAKHALDNFTYPDVAKRVLDIVQSRLHPKIAQKH